MHELEKFMSSMFRLFIDGSTLHLNRSDIVKTYREHRVVEEIERMRRRSLDLAEQGSTLNAPDVRIRTWEKTHALRLPSDSTHPILDVIARDTGLTHANVEEEQRLRLSSDQNWH
jgi:hypothetical protein